MSIDGDLYGEDIHLWSERQSALLRRLAAGEAVTNQIDWPHVVEEIEDVGHTQGRHPSDQDEIARLTAMLKAAEARVNELRSRLDELTGKLADTRAELATVQDQADTAAARATAAIEAERAMREADVKRRTRGRWTRLVAAWRGE
jgi:chromosome segregation ATPase